MTIRERSLPGAGEKLLVVQENPIEILRSETVGNSHWHLTRLRHDSDFVYPSSQCPGVVIVGLVVEEIDQEIRRVAEERRLGKNPNANHTHYGSNSLLAKTQCSCGKLVEADRVKIRLMIPLKKERSIYPQISQT